MNAGEIVLLALGFVGVVVIVGRDILDRPAPGDGDKGFTSKSERVKLTLNRLAEARQFMDVAGIKTLLKGKPHVPAVSHVAPLKKPAITVVQMMRRKK